MPNPNAGLNASMGSMPGSARSSKKLSMKPLTGPFFLGSVGAASSDPGLAAGAGSAAVGAAAFASSAFASPAAFALSAFASSAAFAAARSSSMRWRYEAVSGRRPGFFS